MSGDGVFPTPLVLCADDYAQDAGISQAIRTLADQGRLSATSAMVLAPQWPQEAARLATLRGRIDVGLHLDWTSPFAVAAGHGQPLHALMRWALGAEWFSGGRALARVREVIERQCDAFEQHWRAPPDHVDGHQHVQQFAGIRAMLVQTLVRRYGSGRQAPWLRLSRAPAGQRGLKTCIIGAMGANALKKEAARADLYCAPWLSGIYGFDGGQGAYAQHMAQWLATSPAGTVLMCHPGQASDEPATPDPIAAARAWEWAHLHSPLFAEQLTAAGVQLVRGKDGLP